jgi:hypothetical protein
MQNKDKKKLQNVREWATQRMADITAKRKTRKRAKEGKREKRKRLSQETFK